MIVLVSKEDKHAKTKEKSSTGIVFYPINSGVFLFSFLVFLVFLECGLFSI